MRSLATTLPELIDRQSEFNSARAAILAPERPELSFGDLGEFVRDIARKLHEMGLRGDDTIALVLPNGPEMATAFLATSCACSSAPLNPSYRMADFEFYLKDLNARLVIVMEGTDSPVRDVAARMQIPVAGLVPKIDASAGIFSLQGIGPLVTSDREITKIVPDNVALVLHTSGTTSRPKMVPLTHANICASAKNIIETLQLSESDRCLNIMPLFHIHGLIGALVSSLASGGSVVCSPGYRDDEVFTWFSDLNPTWYTAVPTIHQSILSVALAHLDVIEAIPLRFIRSSSAAMSASVMRELEEVFTVPVVESYGMTEAAHQMASNPLASELRKANSVGPAAGPEMAILNENCELCAAGQIGEVVIRGDNVTPEVHLTLLHK